MRMISGREVRDALPWPELIEALRTGFRAGCESPLRHAHKVEMPGEADASLLLMPAWKSGEAMGVKLVTVTPGNRDRALPAVNAVYVLFDAATGQAKAVLDGEELTGRRTAAASALAASYLARPDASRLLVLGAGRIAGDLPFAHAAVRPIREVAIWARKPAKAEALAAELQAAGFAAQVAEDLESAVASADIISTATLSTEPLIRGDWLRPGQHLDLVGAFRAAMRESDDRAVQRARIFVDTRIGALAEGGDIVQAIRTGAITPEAVQAELSELCSGLHPGRERPEDITLFKSVGCALEDLVAAELVWRGSSV